MKVLVIEHQHSVREAITRQLWTENIQAEFAASTCCAHKKLIDFEYDIVLISQILALDQDHRLIRAIQEKEIPPAILVISPDNTLENKLKAWELGADDVLQHPFHQAELLARLNALYRRIHFEGKQVLTYHEIQVDLSQQEVWIHGKLMPLTTKEYELLLYFLSHKNRVLGKDILAEYIWGDYTQNLNKLDFIYQHIKNLRKKLAAYGAKPYIQTVYGMGYKFKGDRGEESGVS